MCHKLGCLGVSANSRHFVLVLVCFNLGNETCKVSRFNVCRIDVVELHDYTLSGVFEDVEVTKLREHRSDGFGGYFSDFEVFFEQQPDDLFLLQADQGGRMVSFVRIHVEASAVVELVQHHLVQGCLSELIVHVDWRVREISWVHILVHFLELVLDIVLLLFAFASAFVAHLDGLLLEVSFVDFLVLHDSSKGKTSHVGVVCSLVVV